MYTLRYKTKTKTAVAIIVLATILLCVITPQIDCGCACDRGYRANERCQESCEIYGANRVKIEFNSHGSTCWCKREKEE